jgi:hypothetical protein
MADSPTTILISADHADGSHSRVTVSHHKGCEGDRVAQCGCSPIVTTDRVYPPKTEPSAVAVYKHVVREGSRLFVVHEGNRTPLTHDQLENTMLAIADMLYAARHWKERAE